MKKSFIFIVLCCLCWSVKLCPSLEAATITIPDATVKPGEMITLALKAEDLPQDASAFYIKLNYDPAIFFNVRVFSPNSSTVKGRQFVANVFRPGQIIISLASIRPLSGNVILANLRLGVNNTKALSTEIKISKAEINENSSDIRKRHSKIKITQPLKRIVSPRQRR